MRLSNNSAAPEGLPEFARGAGDSALGRRLEAHRDYLTILARMQIGQRLQGKVDPTDVVQETFLHAVRDAAQFRGSSDRELAAWLRQLLAARLADLVRRYCGTQGRDVRLEQALQVQLDHSSQLLDRGRLGFTARDWGLELVLVGGDADVRLVLVGVRLLEVEPAPPVADATGCDAQQQEDDEQFLHGKLHGEWKGPRTGGPPRC